VLASPDGPIVSRRGTVSLMEVAGGSRGPLRDTMICVVRGAGTLETDGESVELGPYDTMQVRGGVRSRFHNGTEEAAFLLAFSSIAAGQVESGEQVGDGGETRSTRGASWIGVGGDGIDEEVLISGGAVSCTVGTYDPGSYQPRHRHLFADEAMVTLDGTASMLVDATEDVGKLGELFVVSEGTWHGIWNDGEDRLVVLHVLMGAHPRRADVERWIDHSNRPTAS
jgi:quercetin dioxygenase-like cupin family protein